MGREIRRVPPTWQHPKDEKGQHVPLYDEAYEDALDNWIEEHRQWERGEHRYQLEGYGKDSQFWADWNGDPPSVESYRRERWTDEEATHWVMYENVTEGTPLTPAFATREELVDFLSTQKDFWGKGPISRDAAEAFTQSGYAPSFVMGPGIGFKSGLEAAAGP